MAVYSRIRRRFFDHPDKVLIPNDEVAWTLLTGVSIVQVMICQHCQFWTRWLWEFLVGEAETQTPF